MIEWFDKKFVYLEWKDELNGKEGFVANSLKLLKSEMMKWSPYKIEHSDNDSFPFYNSIDSSRCASMAYYDPYIKIKEAFELGKTLEYKSKDDYDKWIVLPHDHKAVLECIESEYYDIRIKDDWENDDNKEESSATIADAIKPEIKIEEAIKTQNNSIIELIRRTDTRYYMVMDKIDDILENQKSIMKRLEIIEGKNE
jgi:hypothetical protein